MDFSRRDWLRAAGLLAGATLLPAPFARAANWLAPTLDAPFRRSDFGPNFIWGTATAAYQIEGAHAEDGKGPSIWDTFSHTRGKIKDKTNGDIACDFYHRYAEDIALMRQMGIPTFRFSTAWPRIQPTGTGPANDKGLDFYKRVADKCLENNVQPWVTCYHWDLPQALQDRGGWANRDVLGWFEDYVGIISRALGDRVKHWMVFNEPAAFVLIGHLAGIHAPGFRSLGKTFAATHHATLCHGIGARVLRQNVPGITLGSTFSCSAVHPKNPESPKHQRAAARMDAMVNRLFLDPLCGKGYPWGEDGFTALKRIEKYMQPGDEAKLAYTDFDFYGLQNYFRIVVKPSAFPPVMWANEVKPAKRGPDVQLTEMGWEVYPEGIYEMLKKFNSYEPIRQKQILVTENGAAFPDVVEGDAVHDTARTQFLHNYLGQVLRAKREGVNVNGYMVWSFMDNFEWAEGYHPRFGLVHVDFATLRRTVKDSGRWFQLFLAE